MRWRAAFRYRPGSAGFSDLMILAAAERSGACSLYTFDQKAARLEGVAPLQGRMPQTGSDTTIEKLMADN